MLRFAYKTVSTYCSIQNNLVLLNVAQNGHKPTLLPSGASLRMLKPKDQ